MAETAPTGATDLDATAAWLGAAAWLEGQLFALLGGWVQETPEPEVQALFAAHAHHHAWHAELLRTRVPVRAGDPAEPYVAPSPGGAALVRVLEGLVGREVTVERLAVVFRVVIPRLHAGYRHRLALAPRASDGPLVRALTLVVRDDRDDQLAGEQLLQRVLVDGDAVARAGAVVVAAESAVVLAGGSLP